ncbi:MAG: hypothetical protein M3308_01760, partial [Actinomycetota bacterium]|nr:hypothetical protein [Actinomycetota bacterium]
VLQHAALVAALAVTAGAAAAQLPGGDEAVTGLAVWGFGVGWLLLGWGRVVAARYVAYVCGGAAVVVGAQLALSVGWGAGLALGSAAALVAAGVWLRDLVLLGVGSVATLLTVPAVLAEFFPDTLAAPLALLGVGVLLVAGALYTARWHRLSRKGRDRDRATPRMALGFAAGLGLVVVATVVTLGLT